jgi:hypothetical protein
MEVKLKIYSDDEILHMKHASDMKRARAISRALRHQAIATAQRKAFATAIEDAIMARLRAAGYFVTRSLPNEHFDLLIDGLRIEVKAAALSHRRYQAALRRNDADVIIFVCRDADQIDHYFIMPFDRVRGLTHIEIRNPLPCAYRGWMAPWRDAWHLIDRLIAIHTNHWQLSLGGLS